MYKVFAIVVLLVVSAGHSVHGHESEPAFDRITLSASAEREVENDVLVASLYAEHQAQRQQTVSKEVNAAIQWALEKSKQSTNINIQTTQYNTSPLYNKNAMTGWRARQSIRLESQDANKLSELIGELQERLSIASIHYAVSKAARDLVEESLTSEALAQFRRRADRIARDLGRKSYRIVQINISIQGARPQPMAYATRGVAMESAAAPAIEAGVQTVRVNVSGTIEVDAGSL